MSYKLEIERLAKEVLGTKGLSALKEEGEKIKSELIRARETLKPQAEARLKNLEKAYSSFLQRFGKLQANIAVSLNKAKKSAEKSSSKATPKKAKTSKKTTKKVATKKR